MSLDIMRVAKLLAFEEELFGSCTSIMFCMPLDLKSRCFYLLVLQFPDCFLFALF